MDIKLIALGNRLMGDDGAAIAAAEQLQEELQNQGVQVILGETDAEYSIGYIRDGDDLILLDAALSGKEAGNVWQLPLEKVLENFSPFGSQHDVDLIALFKQRGIRVKGLLICIEAADIRLSWGLSGALQEKLPRICQDIRKIIMEYRGEG